MENKYGERLVVIGVHSAKFPAEKVTENIRHAAARYNLKHPIANDASFRIWRSYGVEAWPTLVLIDAEGRYVGGVSGEGKYDLLDRAIGRLLEESGQKVERKVQPAAEERPDRASLLYPGKVAVGGEPAKLFIADTGHHRIVACDLNGKVLGIYGSGERGLKDGRAAEARFQSPQGLWVEGSTLYVADTENHAIRAISLSSPGGPVSSPPGPPEGVTGVASGEAVRTLAGTGKQGRWGSAGGNARETALNSPWDVLAHQGTLFIAMAGSHQIWRLDLEKGEVRPWVGSGREEIVDGDAEECGLAQPSGLALAEGRLYIADSESSGIRAFDLKERRLSTLVGTGLFDFGDGAGRGGKVLQHPLAVAVDGKDLIIADSYNHRLKRLDLGKGEVRFWLGTGKPGAEDGSGPGFYEPGGLAIHAGKLYVADTNNHRVRVVDLGTGAASTLAIKAP